eukprot:1894781-Karenia_brevis.AAC.1
MFLPIYAKRATDAARALFKVQRGKTPASGSWMVATDNLVRKFELWWMKRYKDDEKRFAYTCQECG